MDQNDYLRQRTDQILRERIALGITAGGARRKRSGSKTVKKRASAKKCPRGKVPRKAHKVKAHTVRAHKTMRGPVRKHSVRAHRVKASCVRPRRAGEGVMVGGEHEMLDLYDSIYGRGEGEGEGVRRRRRRAGEGVMAKAKAGGARRKRTSPWIAFVKKYARDHRVPYAVALVEASPIYRGM